MNMNYAAWMLMGEEDYGDYVDDRFYECMCGRGDGCDCEGHEAKARADEEEGKREARHPNEYYGAAAYRDRMNRGA